MVALAEIAAIAVFYSAVGREPKRKRMICPLPDEPAAESLVGIKRAVVILKVAGAVAHRVAVLAEDIRTGLLFVGKIILHFLPGGVHFRYEVEDISRRIVKTVSAFVMQEPGVVQRLHKLPRRQEIRTPAAFVAQRPEQNAGAVDIPFYQGFGAIAYRCFKALVRGKKRDSVVSLAPL